MNTVFIPPTTSESTASLRSERLIVPDIVPFKGHPEIIGTSFSYSREEEIYGEGEDAEFVYMIARGAVRTHNILSDGRRQITGFPLAGDLFGLGPGALHRHTAEALTETKVLVFKRRQIERAAAFSAEIACQLWNMATDELRHALDLAVLLGRRTAQERIAAFLIEIDGRLGGTGTFALPMTRRDIADYLGLTVETVSRTLSQLEEDGALRRHGGRRISLHHPHLRDLAGD